MNNKFLRGILLGMVFSLALMLITLGVFKLVTKDKSKDNTNQIENYSNSNGQIQSSSSGAKPGTSDSDEKAVFEKKMNNVLGMIDRFYLNEYDKQKMYDLMLKSMVYSLGDPYSTYYTPEEFAALLETTSGEYCGIGATVSQSIETKKLIVVNPFENSPAYKAGMRPNDEIISVDGVSVVGEDINNVVAKMKGEQGTSVKVGVLRGQETLELDIVRDKIEVECVTSKMLDNNVGYIEMTEFWEKTADQLKEQMTKLVNKGANKFILDLRGNPGGLYDDVIKCLDYFVEKNQLLVYTEDKYGKREEEFSKEGVLFDYPMVILVDEQSASAAEIFTGTMQYYKKAVILGTQTFGKGIVQALYPVGNDSSGLKITISKYYLPSKICIHEIGVTPDVVLELDADLKSTLPALREHDNQIDAALNILNN